MSKLFSILFLIIAIFLGYLGIMRIVEIANKNEKELKQCYFESPRSEKCSYMIWKYENRDKTGDIIYIGKM